MMLSAQGVTKSAAELFPSIKAIQSHVEEVDGSDPMVQAARLKSSGFLARLQAAAAVNNSEWRLDDQT
jgi:hypothetical protein